MTKIRAHCPSCGDVEFGVDAIVIVASVADGVGSAPTKAVGRTYRFCCPSCDASVIRSALPEVIDLLVTAGVAVDLNPARPPPRANGRRRTDPVSLSHGAPPISAADLERFRRLLDSPDWFDQLQR